MGRKNPWPEFRPKRFAKVDIFIKYLKHFFYFCALVRKTNNFKDYETGHDCNS